MQQQRRRKGQHPEARRRCCRWGQHGAVCPRLKPPAAAGPGCGAGHCGSRTPPCVAGPAPGKRAAACRRPVPPAARPGRRAAWHRCSRSTRCTPGRRRGRRGASRCARCARSTRAASRSPWSLRTTTPRPCTCRPKPPQPPRAFPVAWARHAWAGHAEDKHGLLLATQPCPALPGTALAAGSSCMGGRLAVLQLAPARLVAASWAAHTCMPALARLSHARTSCAARRAPTSCSCRAVSCTRSRP